MIYGFSGKSIFGYSQNRSEGNRLSFSSQSRFENKTNNHCKEMDSYNYEDNKYIVVMTVVETVFVVCAQSVLKQYRPKAIKNIVKTFHFQIRFPNELIIKYSIILLKSFMAQLSMNATKLFRKPLNQLLEIMNNRKTYPGKTRVSRNNTDFHCSCLVPRSVFFRHYAGEVCFSVSKHNYYP